MAEETGSKSAQRSAPDLPWGITYRGAGEVADVAAATVGALGGLGIACEVRRGADGVVRIEGETRRPWYRLLVGAHPQRVRGLMRARGSGALSPDRQGDPGEGEVRLSLDLSFVPWYRRLVVGLWIGWIVALSALFWFTDPEQFQGGNRPSTILLVGVFVTLAVVFWVPFLLRSLGGARLQTMLWQPILRAIDQAGGYLEPEGTGAGRRFGLWFIGYGTSFLLFGGGAFVLDALESPPDTSPVWSWFFLLLVSLAGLLLCSALALGIWRGFGLRVEAIVLGLGSSVVVLFVLASPLLPAMTAGIAESALRTQPDGAGGWARLIVGGAVMTLVFGVGLGLYLLSLSRYVWQPLRRTYALRGRSGIYRDAVGGGALLVAARGFFGVYAVAVVGVVLVSLAVTAVWAGQALGLVAPEALPLRAPVASGPLLAAALGRPPDTAWIGLVARALWVGWAVFVWGLVAISVGQRVADRCRRRLELLRWAPTEAKPRHRILIDRAKRLTRGKGMPPVRLAVRPGKKPATEGETKKKWIGAYAYRFAWPRRQWFIEVTDGAVEQLEPDEIEALLAHELAHLRRGHVLALDLLCWIGRVAFVGDGFCRGLLDSFGWELRADREAVLALREMGEREDALAHCLWRIAVVNPSAAPLDGADGLGADAPEKRDPEDGVVPDWAGLRVAWRRFLHQYLGRSPLEYWHPSTDERTERIRRIQAMSDPEKRPDGTDTERKTT